MIRMRRLVAALAIAAAAGVPAVPVAGGGGGKPRARRKQCVRRILNATRFEDRVLSGVVDRRRTVEVAAFPAGDASRYFSVFDLRRAGGGFAAAAACGGDEVLLCVESQPIQDTFNVRVPERIFGSSLSSRRELGERIRTVQESWETSSI